MTNEERELSITYLEEIKEKYIEGEGYERHPIPEYYAIENAIKALEQQSEDAISRAETVQFLTNHSSDFEDVKIRMAFQTASSLINNPHNLPPVHPMPKTGHWIRVDYLFHRYKCSNCGDVIWIDENHSPYRYSPYCCKCGYRMIKPQTESEET